MVRVRTLNTLSPNIQKKPQQKSLTPRVKTISGLLPVTVDVMNALKNHRLKKLLRQDFRWTPTE